MYYVRIVLIGVLGYSLDGIIAGILGIKFSL